MKRLCFIAISLLTFATVFGQTVPSSISSKEHQNITGTKISLIPPKGFINAPNFLGLQQTQSGATIMVVDIPGPFSEISKGLTKEGFLSQGVEVKDIEYLTLNNLPAILITGVQNAHGNMFTKFVLCFGTNKETIMINAAFPVNLTVIGKEIKASMLSSYYEADKKIDPLEVVDYEVNVSASKLIFAKSVSNSLIFTTDGVFPTKSSDNTSLIIAKSFSNTNIEDRKLFSLNRLKQLPIEVSKTENMNQITIDGISGYEIVASGKDKKSGEEKKIYQSILFTDNLYYIFVGSTNQNFDDNIKEFKKIVETFNRK